MKRHCGLMLAAILFCQPVFGASAPPAEDPFFAEALFWARQGLYFDALERLDAEIAQHHGLDEPELDTLYPFINDAEFFVGDFELNYRMHHRAGRAITAVLEGNVSDSVRNEAAFRLARIHFQKGQLDDALNTIERIDGPVPTDIRDDVEFLRASIYLATAQPELAKPVLRKLQGVRELKGFTEYNLAIAELQAERPEVALSQFDKAGSVKASDEATLAIRDKGNLIRGTMLLETGRYAEAKQAFDQVRLDGPFSNQALLSAGWADAHGDRFQRAVVPWNILAKRDQTDPAVQEAMLALPHAYGELNVHGRAAVLYSHALESFGSELARLDASLTAIREGRFLEALVREEIRKDRDWVIRLRELPEAPETFYLMTLMASHDFQTGLSNYLDLEDLRKRLRRWQTSFLAFEDIISTRRAYYEPLLPQLDAQFREVDSQYRLRLEQHQILSDRLQNLLVAPRPEFLATTRERTVSLQLAGFLDGLDASKEAALVQRIERLQGLITWQVKTNYHHRLTEFYENLQRSQVAIDQLKAQYDGYVRTRQAATHSYVGYEVPIQRMKTRVGSALARIELLMARQGNMLEQVAMRELKSRIQRLEGYEERARYAMADSYDRAAAAQASITPSVEAGQGTEGE